MMEGVMGIQRGALFDSEAIDIMHRALHETMAKLPAELQSPSVKVEMAAAILRAASAGDRNLNRLRNAALLTVITRHRSSARQPRRAKSA
jgi:hypothetical protein